MTNPIDKATTRPTRHHLLSIVAVSTLLLQAGCASVRSTENDVTAVRYDSGACFGTCPQFSYRIDHNGKATFDGRRFTAVEGSENAPGDREIFQKLVATLASARPAEGKRDIGRKNCARFITDQPTVTVFWEQTNDTRQLSYNKGCRDPQYAELREQLEAARGLLPVGTMIGER